LHGGRDLVTVSKLSSATTGSMFGSRVHWEMKTKRKQSNAGDWKGRRTFLLVLEKNHGNDFTTQCAKATFSERFAAKCYNGRR